MGCDIANVEMVSVGGGSKAEFWLRRKSSQSGPKGLSRFPVRGVTDSEEYLVDLGCGK